MNQPQLAAGRAIYYERNPEGEWDNLTQAERQRYADLGQAALEAAGKARKSVYRNGVPINRSVATKRVTLRRRVDWLKDASEDAQRFLDSNHPALQKPGLREATLVLAKAGPLVAEILDGDEDVKNAGDFGKEFVRRWSALRNLRAVR